MLHGAGFKFSKPKDKFSKIIQGERGVPEFIVLGILIFLCQDKMFITFKGRFH
jgi:hypothetical protein